MSIINICINNVNREYYLEEGSSGIVLENIVKDIESEYKGYITLANINNKLRELSYKVKEDCNIKFIDTTNADGSRVYSRTMSFIFIMACNELFDKARVTIEHSLSRGLYCEVHTNTKLQDFDLKNIKNKMQDIIDKNYKIEKISTTKSNAIKIFEEHGMYEKAELLRYKEHDDVKIYKCNNYINHFYGHMLPSTGYIKTFDLKQYEIGVILLGPSESDKTKAKKYLPQPKLANIYKEAEEWAKVIDVDKEKKRLVLSAKELLREKAEKERRNKISNIEVGFVTEGTVESLQPYGAFVDLGNGISGLVHISQICEKRIKKPSEAISVGDKVKVKVIAIKDGKLSLSI